MKLVIVNSILYQVPEKIFKQFNEIGTKRIDTDDDDILSLMSYIQEKCKVIQTQIPVYMT